MNVTLSVQISQRLFARLRRRWADYGFMAAFVILILIAASFSDVFFTQRNISNLFRQIVTNGLISLGMLTVILTGGIDLSVGSIVALSAILSSGLQQQVPLPLAILAALMAGGLVGIVNGVLVARFRLAPFIVTLATLGAVRGVVYVYSETPQTPTDPAFRAILGGFIGPVPVAAAIMLICFPLVWVFLNRMAAGRAIVAIGGNQEAVRLAGIDVSRHIILAYVISGFFSATAGILLAARLGIAQPSVGAGYELDAIAACVIGGAVLGGGGGGAIGTFGGVFTLGLIDNLLNMFNVQTYYQQILKGLIILFAVLARRKEQ
ncbi:MAG: ABC transporter permease [Anaerolineae bacterium]|nr:ABC transporter permease [Anaerolineae bacterium]MDW8070515.1 ABC transporter permease [Anaerolineae bacterium]